MTRSLRDLLEMSDEAAAEILVVDDTPANLKLLARLLAEQGYQVRPAANGALALRSVAAKAPDLILLDVRMPDLDGYTVCQRLKADPCTHAIPVIFISALHEATDKVEGFAAGGVDYITKPFEPAEVLARVKTHLELGRLQQHLERRVAARTAELAEVNHALRESEERLRLVMEATRDGVWDWNLRTNQMFFSDRWYAMLDYAPGEFVASYAAWRDRVHPDDLAAVEATVQAHWEGRLAECNIEYRMRAKNGDWKWINSRGKVVEWNEDGKPVRLVGTNVDIADRKRAEERLLFTNALLSAQQDASIDGILVVDEQGKILSSNRRFAEIWGIPEPILSEQSDERAIRCVLDQLTDPQEFLDRIRDLYAPPNAKGREEIVLKDGRVIDRYSSPTVGPDGKYYGRTWFFRDITERKRAEKELRLAQLSILWSADAVFWITPEGRFINVNDQACASLGYTRAELLTMAVWDIDPDFSPERWSLHWERTQQLKKRRFETRHRRKDGTIFPVEVTANDVEYEDQEYDFAFVRDITERKRVEEALRVSEHKFRAVVQNAQAITFILDRQGVFLLSEGQGLVRLGLAPGQVVGMSAFDLYKEYPSVVDSIRKALSGELAHVTNVLDDVIFDTVYSPYRDSDGQPRGVIGIAVDITERKRVETALRESEARLRAALESVPFDFFFIGADGRYVLQNSASKKDWGDVVGKRPEDVARDPEMLAHWHSNNRKAFAGEIVQEEVRLAVDGEARYVYNLIAPVKDRDAIIGIAGLNIDITERRRAEAELQRHREHLEELVAARTAELHQAMNQLVQAEKLAALGQLVAGVAHELNTPLGNARVVAGALGAHLREFAAAVGDGALRRSQVDAFLERGREAVDLLERNAARAADLIGQFKQVAVDQTSMRRRRFDLRRTVEELLATLQPQFKRTAHRIELDIPPDLELDSYPGPLEQVLANLIANSLTHGFASIETGTIRIHAASLDSTHVRIDYTDNGIGIPETMLKRIFEPFFTTKLGHGGSGLGLYIVYNLVTGVLGGAIQVHGRPEQGVAFTLVVPTVAPASPDPHRL